MADEVTTNSLVLTRKKGVRRVHLYQQAANKKCRLRGLEYKNKQGALVKSRNIGEDCKCKKKCFENIGQVRSEEIFTYFYNSLDTKDEQDRFLQTLIDKVAITKRKNVNQEREHRRNVTFKYSVRVPSESATINVCKRAFSSLYGLSQKRLKRLLQLNREGKVAVDLRGKKCGSHSLPVEQKIMVHEHIRSFPVKETHYYGRVAQYLDARLSVKSMYKMFKIQYSQSLIKYEYYLTIFKDNFALRFGRPQIDTCVTCEELNVKLKNPHLNEGARRSAQAELDVHKRKAKKFSNKLNELTEKCKQDGNICCLAFDYMQNLPLPHIPVQDIFYLRQLWVNVFGIHDVSLQKTRFYVYHEGQAKKGANEVCSFLLDYIKDAVPPNVTELHLFCDGPTGQNKNHSMVRICAALVETERFQKVVQHYPIRGHSWLPCDRDFGVIKRKIGKHDRIYTPKQYVEEIVHASVQKKFTVKMVSSEDIVNIDEWWPHFYQKNSVSVETRGRNIPAHKKINFTVTSFMQFIHENTHTGYVITKPYIDGLLQHTFKLRSGNAPITLPSCKAYSKGCVSINPKKIKDITGVMKYIPEEYLPFYDAIVNWETGEDMDIEVEVLD